MRSDHADPGSAVPIIRHHLGQTLAKNDHGLPRLPARALRSRLGATDGLPDSLPETRDTALQPRNYLDELWMSFIQLWRIPHSLKILSPERLWEDFASVNGWARVAWARSIAPRIPNSNAPSP